MSEKVEIVEKIEIVEENESTKEPTILEVIKSGIFTNNPTFVQVIGMCPTLAVTTSMQNGLGMGIATTAVLAFSNLLISLLRKIIPNEIRIPSFVIIIATLSTVVELLLKAYLPALNRSLGIFIPLIVVNCIILARAEAFASENKPIISFMDGISMGLGFTVALGILGAIREILGNGTISLLNLVLPEAVPRFILFILPPGAFITLGFVMAFINQRKLKKDQKQKVEG